MFTNSSHLDITGGNFVNIGRDFNFEAGQAAENLSDVLKGLDFGLGRDSGRPLVGAERNERRGGARMLPYGTPGIFSRCTRP
jgi:hypothetical protein